MFYIDLTNLANKNTKTAKPTGKPINGVATALTNPAVATPPSVEKIRGIAIAINDEATPLRLKTTINRTATMAITKGINTLN